MPNRHELPPMNSSVVINALARLSLTAIFLGSAANKIMNTSDTVQLMDSVGIPFAQVTVYAAITFLVVGGMSVLVGYRARFGASLLITFLVLATYYFHDFWNKPDDPNEMIAFLKNVGLLGGLGIVLANGPGAPSFDTCSATHCGVRNEDGLNEPT